MGILINRLDDLDLYDEVYNYAQFIIETAKPHASPIKITGALKEAESSLYKKLGFDSESALKTKLAAQGYLVRKNHKYELTDKGRLAGGEVTETKNGGKYRAWPSDFEF